MNLQAPKITAVVINGQMFWKVAPPWIRGPRPAVTYKEARPSYV